MNFKNVVLLGGIFASMLSIACVDAVTKEQIEAYLEEKAKPFTPESAWGVVKKKLNRAYRECRDLALHNARLRELVADLAQTEGFQDNEITFAGLFAYVQDQYHREEPARRKRELKQQQEVPQNCSFCLRDKCKGQRFLKNTCGHQGCFGCFLRWHFEKNTCPACNAPLGEKVLRILRARCNHEKYEDARVRHWADVDQRNEEALAEGIRQSLAEAEAVTRDAVEVQALDRE